MRTWMLRHEKSRELSGRCLPNIEETPRGIKQQRNDFPAKIPEHDQKSPRTPEFFFLPSQEADPGAEVTPRGLPGPATLGDRPPWTPERHAFRRRLVAWQRWIFDI